MTQESATSLSEAAAHVTAAPPPDLDPVTESHAPDDPAHSDVHGDMESPFTGPSKKKKKKQTTASRGPTALAKNRGTGFEGTFLLGRCLRLQYRDFFSLAVEEN